MANPKIPVEIFGNYIIEKLRRANPHLDKCVDASGNVIGGAVVHIPQAGASPGVSKNRAFGAAVAVQRGDSAITYALDVFTTDPTAITWAEGAEISYDKTNSVIGDHFDTIAESVGNEIAYSWIKGLIPQNDGSYTTQFLPNARRIATSGDAVAVNGVDGQTGNRKATHYRDFDMAQAMFNKDNVPASDRFALCEAYMLKELQASFTGNMMAAFQQTADLANGVIGKYAGFTFLDRSFVLAAASNGTFRLPGEALSATDNLACLVWQKQSVEKAMGDKKLFQDLNNPLYYGDIHSSLVKAGGRCRRADWKGIGVIIQAAAA